MTVADALLKSIIKYDEYSLFANSSAIVDLPMRLAPCIIKALSPSDSCFH